MAVLLDTHGADLVKRRAGFEKDGDDVEKGVDDGEKGRVKVKKGRVDVEKGRGEFGSPWRRL